MSLRKYIVAEIIAGVTLASILAAAVNYFILDDEETTYVDKAYTCDPKKYKVYESCRRLIVDKHWEDYVKHRSIVDENCGRIADFIACTEIKEGAMDDSGK